MQNLVTEERLSELLSALRTELQHEMADKFAEFESKIGTGWSRSGAADTGAIPLERYPIELGFIRQPNVNDNGAQTENEKSMSTSVTVPDLQVTRQRHPQFDSEIQGHCTNSGQSSENVTIRASPTKSASLIGMMHIQSVDTENEQHLTNWQGSVWETAIFIALPQLGLTGTTLLLISLLVNIFLQLACCTIILRTFPSEPVDHSKMTKWRHLVGHHIQHTDSYGHTLVSRLCNSYPTLSMAGTQENLLNDVNLYIGRDDNGQAYGPILCGLVLTIWFMLWLKETDRSLQVARELWRLPLSDVTEVVATGDGNFQLGAVQLPRKIFGFFVCLSRFVVSVLLLIQGSVWLLHTTSVTELVLNAVALAFIFDIDELMYEIFVPSKSKQFLDTLVRKSHGNTKMPGVYLFALLAFTIYAYVDLIHPNMEHMQKALDATCNGNTDFTIGYHEGLGVLFYAQANTRFLEEDLESRRDIMALIAHEHPKSAILVPESSELVSLLSKKAGHVADEFVSSCRDTTPSEFPAFWRRLRSTLQFPNALSCHDVVSACGHKSAALVRMLCPETCRCFYPKPSSAISQGCPYWTCQDNRATAGYYDSRLNCTDDEVSSLSVNAHWLNYWQSLSVLRPEFDEPRDLPLTVGCAAIVEYKLYNLLCGETQHLHSLGTYCPETCKCAQNDYWGCARHCYIADDYSE